MSLKLIKQTFASSLLVVGIIFSGQIHAHGGLALADDLCILTVGPYTMHFTGYQPLTQEEEFCEDIPEIGKTVVALDYVNDELRPLLTEVRIIRDTGSEANLDEITVYHLPPQVYPTASITLDHTFPEKGKFVGLVTVTGGAETYISRFPFSVGEGRKNRFMTTILPGIVIVAAGAFFFMRSRRKPNVPADS
ncbi:MAG: hypothetical protein Q8L82_05590 [Nitrosomonas sp.]|nr:hypothetical protein [Nitrosomonas sp.]